MRRKSSRRGMRPQGTFLLFAALLVVIWLCGGSSRADVLGQALVRAAAGAGVVFAALFVAKIDVRSSKPVCWLLAAIIILPLIQLVPLPPAMWMGLPGRELFVEPTNIAGGAQPWRPLSISPGATLNALFSLIVPVGVLVLVAGLRENERSWLLSALLLSVIGSMLIGLLQFSGAGFDNPFINGVRGSVDGTFANRNHFALFLALGCLMAPAWAFVRADQLSWRLPAAVGLALLAALTILATGSRAGMAVGVCALCLGPLLVREDVARLFRSSPKWMLPASIATLAAVVTAFVVVSFLSGRAMSIDRMAMLDLGGDMRQEGLESVLAIIGANFPFGVGIGGFDAAFRMAEPDEFLKLLYFNHAHNDLLELVLEAGAFGVALLGGALWWWGKASFRVWRRTKPSSEVRTRGRLGSAMILLVLLASAADYPARTPMIMAVLVIAACWLAWAEREANQTASLPRGPRSL